MIDKCYKSIFEITGVKLPTALDIIHNKLKRKDVIIKEQFQVAYIMYYLEGKSHVKIAKTLSMSVYKVKKILTSYICNMMKLHDWQPMYKCANRDVAKDEKGYVFEYADLVEIEAQLDNYEKQHGKDDGTDD